jgi:2-aminoadipate transaminase
MAALKRYMDLETSPLLQAALVDFLRSGAVDRYLHELRSMMRRRHAVAQEALSQHMPSGFSWTKPDGGLALWVEGPVGFDGEVLARVAADRGVLVSPGRLFHPVDVVDPGLRLSLSRADESQIREGIRILGQCVSESPTGRPSHRPLIL